MMDDEIVSKPLILASATRWNKTWLAAMPYPQIYSSRS